MDSASNSKIDPNSPFMRQIIKLLVDENPKRVGTKSHERFKLYTNGMTVYSFISAGGTRADVNWDVAHEYISLSVTRR